MAIRTVASQADECIYRHVLFVFLVLKARASVGCHGSLTRRM